MEKKKVKIQATYTLRVKIWIKNQAQKEAFETMSIATLLLQIMNFSQSNIQLSNLQSGYLLNHLLKKNNKTKAAKTLCQKIKLLNLLMNLRVQYRNFHLKIQSYLKT